MKIWAHTLVKNEAKWLWYAVTGVIDYVDKLLLWDSGSTDGSLKIEEELKKKYPEKIILDKRVIDKSTDFATVRQEMLDETKSDWFIMLDGDEIWWRESIQKVLQVVKSNTGITGENMESIVVPTLNMVGDIFHYQKPSAGNYHFGETVGHYNLRAVNRNIPGLHSLGEHGVWGWADSEGKQIQDRNTYKFIEAPYMHMTHLTRSGSKTGDKEVIKRKKKLKYELGVPVPLNFYYPEVFFYDRPDYIESPWQVMLRGFKFRAFFETLPREVKRKLWRSRIGY